MNDPKSGKITPYDTAYIGIGSNLGDRRANIEESIQRLTSIPGIDLAAVSDLYETEPVGNISQGWFLNLVIAVQTRLTSLKLFRWMQRVEQDMGRQRTTRWGPRQIDLDLLIYEDQCLETAELTIPHPRMHDRRFVLEPLCQIAPNLKHPHFQVSVESLLNALKDDKVVHRLSEIKNNRQ